MNHFTPIGLGTWNMETDPQRAIAALRAGFEAGANHIDTAEMYGGGEVEKIVGEALKGWRDKVFVVSKVLPSNANYKSTIEACERSLRQLETDYLDIYLLHWRQKRTPLAETFRAFEKLKSDGKIKAWGVSNFNESDLNESVRIAGQPSIKEGRLVCNQVYYSIDQRAVEALVLPWCEKYGVKLVAYSPLGQGNLPHHKILDELSRELRCTPAQIALAFLIQNKNVIAIPKSSDPNRTRENVQAMTLHLSSTQMERLSSAFPTKLRRTLPMV